MTLCCAVCDSPRLVFVLLSGLCRRYLLLSELLLPCLRLYFYLLSFYSQYSQLYVPYICKDDSELNANWSSIDRMDVFQIKKGLAHLAYINASPPLSSQYYS